MTVEPLVVDAPLAPPPRTDAEPNAFGAIVNDLGAVLNRAERSEDAFAAGSGNLAQAMYERARADVALSVAVAAAQRTAQALNTVLNMQV